MTANNQPVVSFTIDGRTLRAEEGTFVLDVAREAGIDIPTLCNHPDLEPVGACRVCMVEVTHPDWNGWSGLMTACLYPVKDGIQVSTRSERVKSARRGVLSLLAARCPNSDIIQRLADEYGARADGLTTDPEADNCILCGLCTRVCETYATGAITTAGRGAVKRIASFADRPPQDCVGCGACVAVCPTTEVKGNRAASAYHVWDREFPTAICTVHEAQCIGCGSCEEACPFSVARVALRAGGHKTAVIASDFCRGCGACVGACPCGAISQRGLETARVLQSNPGSTQVYACGRSNLRRLEDPAVHVTEMPCTGRVTVPMLLGSLASGAAGVLVLGRHQRTCRFEGAEDPVRERVDAARELIGLAGLEPDRIRFEEPAPGPDGPADAVKTFSASLCSLPPNVFAQTSAPQHEGLDASIALFQSMRNPDAAQAGPTAFLRRHGLAAPEPGGPVLLAGSIPMLHLLGSALFAPVDLINLLRASLAVLDELDVTNVGVQLEGQRNGGVGYALEPAANAGTVMIDTLLGERGARLPRPPIPTRIGTDGTDAQRRIVTALGHEPVDVGPDPLPPTFAMSPQERREAENRLLAAERAGAPAVLVTDPMALARWALLTRSGAWRTSRVLPVMGVALAHLSLLGRPLARASLESPHVGAVVSEVLA